MEITVVITTFKNPERLKKALDTVKKQTFKDIEIIVVDGANSKECEKIAKKNGAIFIGLLKDLPPPNGVQRSRNVGINASKGKYIAFLDDDDEWTPMKLELQHREIKKGSDFVSCNTLVRYQGKQFEDKKGKNPSFKDLLKNFAISSTSSIMARKEVLISVGGWNETIRGMHEYDLVLRVSRSGYKISNVQLPLMIKNQDFSAQIGSVYWKISEMFEFIRLYKKDILTQTGLRGYIFNILKMWTQILIYSFTFVIGDKVWKLLYFFRIIGGFNDKNKRKHEGIAQNFCD